MKFRKLVLWYSVCIINIHCSRFYDDVDFLEDFFENKSTRITMSCCWEMSIKIYVHYYSFILILVHFLGKIRLLFRWEKPKQMVIYRNISENSMDSFFSDLSTGNWFVMDFMNCENYEILPKVNIVAFSF